eukprot:3061474-Amphidinium_carterae.2
MDFDATLPHAVRSTDERTTVSCFRLQHADHNMLLRVHFKMDHVSVTTHVRAQGAIACRTALARALRQIGLSDQLEEYNYQCVKHRHASHGDNFVRRGPSL